MKNYIVLALALLSAQSVFAAGGKSTTQVYEDDRSDRFMQIRIEPHWLVFKEIGADFQFRITDKFTLGPTIAIMRDSESIMYGTMTSTSLGGAKDHVNRESLGARGVYYFNAFNRSSALLSGFARYSKSHVTTTYDSSFLSSESRKGEFSETSAGVTGGYQWVWGKFTMNVGGGIAYFAHPEKVILSDDKGNTSTRKTEGSNLSYALDAGIGLQF